MADQRQDGGSRFSVTRGWRHALIRRHVAVVTKDRSLRFCRSYFCGFCNKTLSLSLSFNTQSSLVSSSLSRQNWSQEATFSPRYRHHTKKLELPFISFSYRNWDRKFFFFSLLKVMNARIYHLFGFPSKIEPRSQQQPSGIDSTIYSFLVAQIWSRRLLLHHLAGNGSGSSSILLRVNSSIAIHNPKSEPNPAFKDLHRSQQRYNGVYPMIYPFLVAQIWSWRLLFTMSGQ